MSDFESVIEADSQLEFTSGRFSDAAKRKWSVYRLNSDIYERLLAKKRRGDKINFKERGGDHVLTLATHEPTARELKELSGAGCYIIEHLHDGIAVDWSFGRVEPNVTTLANEGGVSSIPSSDPTSAFILQRLGEIEQRQQYQRYRERYERRPGNRVRRLRSTTDRSNQQQQLELILRLQREAFERERVLYQQVLEARAVIQEPREAVDADDDDSKALRLILQNPGIRRRAQDALADLLNSDAPDWKSELVRGLFDRAPQILAGVQMLAQQQSGVNAAAPSSPTTLPTATPPMDAPTQSQVIAPTFEHNLQVVFNNMLQDLQQDAATRRSARELVSLIQDYPGETQNLVAMLGQSGDVISQTLATMFPQVAEIVTRDGAIAWFDSLRDEMNKRFQRKQQRASSELRSTAIVPEAVSKNGQAAKAEVGT